jgi:methylenetetrahydrofolate reductase (NADPH)
MTGRPDPFFDDPGGTASELGISFEFFPPQTPAMEARLWDVITRLEPLSPRFVSVTYGADGGTRERTHATVERILKETSLVPAAHLTCVGAAREEVDDVARAYWDLGVRHIVALRGDPPAGAARYEPHPRGYAYASDLATGLKRIADFEISVAAFPEAHPEAQSATADLDNLKRKIDAGACRAITQFFFDPAVYLRFLDRARAAGIDAPIVPGILPITNFARVASFAEKCGTAVPGWLRELFEDLDDDAEARNLVAAATAVEQCRFLQAYGIDEFHFYTLNRAELTAAIHRMLHAPATHWVVPGLAAAGIEARA